MKMAEVVVYGRKTPKNTPQKKKKMVGGEREIRKGENKGRGESRRGASKYSNSN
jgi:hypothetical protein